MLKFIGLILFSSQLTFAGFSLLACFRGNMGADGDISRIAKDKISIKYEDKGYANVHIDGINGILSHTDGTRIPIPSEVNFPTRNIYGHVLKPVLAFRNGLGKFVVITREFHTESSEAKSENQAEHLRQSPEYTRGDLWQYLLLNPSEQGPLGIYADRDILIMPTIETFNSMLSSRSYENRSGSKEVAIRFRTSNKKLRQSERYAYTRDGALAFFEAFTRGEEYRSDVTGHLMQAGLSMPSDVILRFVNLARFIQKASEDPFIAQHMSYEIDTAKIIFSEFFGRIARSWSYTEPGTTSAVTHTRRSETGTNTKLSETDLAFQRKILIDVIFNKQISPEQRAQYIPGIGTIGTGIEEVFFGDKYYPTYHDLFYAQYTVNLHPSSIAPMNVRLQLERSLKTIAAQYGIDPI